MLKKIIIPLLITFILIVGGIVYILVFQKPVEQLPVLEEKTLEEKLQNLTAPSGETPEVSEEAIESLTASGGGEEVSEEVLQSLTAPPQ